MRQFFLALFLLLCGPGLGAAEGPLVVLTSADNPPYEFVRGGEIVGFEIDLCRLVCQKLNRDVQFRDMPFSSLIPALKSGRGDLAVATLTETPARRQQIAFSQPFEEAVWSVFVAPKVALQEGIALDEATAMADFFSGKTIGVQLGSQHESSLKAMALPNLRLRPYETISMMLAELGKGRRTIDGIVLGEPEARTIVQTRSDLVFCRLPFSGKTAIGLPLNSPLREAINRILEEVRLNGDLEAIRNRWLGRD